MSQFVTRFALLCLIGLSPLAGSDAHADDFDQWLYEAEIWLLVDTGQIDEREAWLLLDELDAYDESTSQWQSMALKSSPYTSNVSGLDLGSGRIRSVSGLDLGSGRFQSVSGLDLGSGR